jgi:diacylglycerol kinase (ATP)
MTGALQSVLLLSSLGPRETGRFMTLTMPLGDATAAGIPEPRRALLLLNRKARNGGAPIEEALNVLRRGGIEVEERSCDGSAAMAEAIDAGAKNFDCVIVGGGDGTLNCAAKALVKAKLPLGILPLGTANDLARTLGIGPDAVAAASIIVAAHRRDIDLGEVNGHPFFNVASIGFSAELARELTSDLKRKFGTLGYAFAGARLLARMRPFTALITHDGITERVKTLQIAVGNGRHYGGGLTVALNAQPDDGLFDVYSLEVAHWWRLVALVPWLKAGTQGSWRDVRAFRTAEVTIRTRRKRSVNTDGELTSTTPASFKIVRRAVSVYVPAPLTHET